MSKKLRRCPNGQRCRIQTKGLIGLATVGWAVLAGACERDVASRRGQAKISGETYDASSEIAAHDAMTNPEFAEDVSAAQQDLASEAEESAVGTAVAAMTVAGGNQDGVIYQSAQDEQGTVTASGGGGPQSTVEGSATNQTGNPAPDVVTVEGQRIVRIDTASVPTGQLPHVKLVMIVDNSFSMNDKQAKLAQAMGRVADSLRGYNLEVFLYTTTIHNGYPKPTIDHQIHATVMPSGAVFNMHVADDLAHLPHTEITDYVLADPYNGGAALNLDKDMEDGPFALFKGRFIDAIAQVGTGGDDWESGLCTLALVTGLRRSMTGKLNLELGDFVGYVILSDEEDMSLVNCSRQNRSEHRVEYDVVPVVANTLAEAVFLQADASYREVDYRGSCQGAYRDGVLLVNDVTEAHFSEDACRSHPTLCPEVLGVRAPCSEPQREHFHNKVCAADGLGDVLSCTVQLINFNSDHRMFTRDSLPCDQAGAQPVNLTTAQDNEGGRTVTPLGTPLSTTWRVAVQELHPERDYIGCTQNLWRFQTTWNIGYETTQSYFDRRPVALNNAAAAISGVNGYFISAIINDAATNSGLRCTLAAHESMGSEYRAVVDSAPTGQGTVQSICAADYWPAVEPLTRFVQQVTENSYVFDDVVAAERILEIAIIRGTQVVTVAPSAMTVVGSRVSFVAGVLMPGDTIQATIGTAP